MRTNEGQRLYFAVRHILIIDDNSYTVVDEKDVREAIANDEAVLIMRFYAPDICIAVYDFTPREHTSAMALKIAKSYVAVIERSARLN